VSSVRGGRARRARLTLGVAVGLALVLVAAACTGDDEGGDEAETVNLDGAGEAEFEAYGNVEGLTVTGLEPGTSVQLVDADGVVVQPAAGDEEGNVVFRRLEPGDGYRVASGEGDDLVATDEVEVLSVDDHPDQAFYDDQVLEEGLNYIETRDGVTLSAMVRFPENPLPGTPEGGPYPTIVEYSGYSPSDPNSPQPATQILDLYGFATVGVNMRGSGCSGGAFDFFDVGQVVDGYDVIETVAAQDWVANHQVGMAGLSYPGVSQLYVAATQPPSLAAIAPQSVLADTYRSTLYPGGIFNNGFAQSWAAERQASVAAYGQEWTVAQVEEEGDEVCEANQSLRSRNVDLLENARRFDHYRPEYFDRIAPRTFVDQIEAPVLLTGQWQDEQTGGQFGTMLDELLEANDQAQVVVANGAHADGLAPQGLQRMVEFLDLYVAQRVPEVPPSLRAGAPAALGAIFGQGDLALPPDRFADAGSYEEALAEYEALDPVTVLWESGAGAEPGIPQPTAVQTFSSWPPSEVTPTTWYLGPDGGLSEVEPTIGDDEEGSAASFLYDATAGEETSYPSQDQNAIFQALPDYQWTSPTEGTAAAFVTSPLDEAITIAGPSSADLSFGSTEPDVDVQVTLTEVRPDGQEVYVTAGWLRASHRALDEEASTELEPFHTHLEGDAEPLPEGELAELRVELFPATHVFREGSQIRLVVDSPGADRPLWKFESIDTGAETTNVVGTSAGFPSALVLPVLEGGADDVPTELPPCPGLRGQPCRTYEQFDNTPAVAEGPS